RAWREVQLGARLRFERWRAGRMRGRPADERELIALYRAYLGRDPDAGGLRFYLERVRAGRFEGAQLRASIRASPEFRRRWNLPLDPLTVVHHARCRLVAEHLPPADVIVDLGGASDGGPEGALIIMGYPHAPSEIVIIDLPPDERLGGATA